MARILNSMKAGVLALIITAGIAGPAGAQDLGSALLDCRAIEDSRDRLACYDNVAGALSQGRMETSAAPVTRERQAAAPAPAAPVLTAEESFGRDDLPEVRKEENEKKLKMITANVVEIGRNNRGKYVVILDNGQIWRQINADTNRLRVPKDAEGLVAEVKRKMLGAHDLSLNTGNRTIRVERIK